MNVLLDTHTLLWLVSHPHELGSDAVDVLAAADTSIWVSAASAWEIAIKTRIGRLDASTLLATWSTQLEAMRIDEIPIASQDAILAGGLAWDHRDPFDRVIVAQAVRRNLIIATRDAKIMDAALAPTLEV